MDYLLPGVRDNSWGKLYKNSKALEEGLGKEMLSIIKALKSSHIFHGI